MTRVSHSETLKPSINNFKSTCGYFSFDEHVTYKIRRTGLGSRGNIVIGKNQGSMEHTHTGLLPRGGLRRVRVCLQTLFFDRKYGGGKKIPHSGQVMVNRFNRRKMYGARYGPIATIVDRQSVIGFDVYSTRTFLLLYLLKPLFMTDK